MGNPEGAASTRRPTAALASLHEISLLPGGPCLIHSPVHVKKSVETIDEMPFNLDIQGLIHIN
jgi:hypothetical protein